jgi:hypothetical protein
MQINPFYFRWPLLFLFILLFWGDPSHSKISAEELVVDEDVLDDLWEQGDGPESQRMKPFKPPTGEPDVEMLVKGVAKSFSEVTNFGEAPTPIQLDPKPPTEEGNGQQQDGAGNQYDKYNPIEGSDKANSATDALKVAAAEKAGGIPVVSCICIVMS